MKKNYMKPTLNVVFVQAAKMICASEVTGVSGNASFTYGGGGSGAAMSREGDWDDDEE